MDNSYEEYLMKHQIECIKAINNHKDKKCLINQWCGTGKTRTFTIKTFLDKVKLTVLVFPSLGLINQYNKDYVLRNDYPFTEFKNYKTLSFCSEKEKTFNELVVTITTDTDTLLNFLTNHNNKIVTVTYQSFDKFVNCCINNNIKINRIVYDEAHNVLGENIQKTIFNNNNFDNIVDKIEFWTATPVNRNGITMYDNGDDDIDIIDCGKCVYNYYCYQAVEDCICKPIETQLCLYTVLPKYQNKFQPIFEIIIRACLSNTTYDYWNILTYHTYVNPKEKKESITFVKDFANNTNQRLLKKLFIDIQKNEYPDTIKLFNVNNLSLIGVGSKTNNRNDIINNFNKKVKGRIQIIASCGILNEGIDTNTANMAVPINPSKSIVTESQRLGRIMRKTEEMHPGILLVPCFVNLEKYNVMETPEQQSDMIRQELSETGDFNIMLNVISALKYQYDSDIFELLLKYPNSFSPKEIENNLQKQGFKINRSKGDLLDNINSLIKDKINKEEYDNLDDKEILQKIVDKNDIQIDIHTQNIDKPIETYGKDCECKINLFYNQEEKIYYPIESKGNNKKINPPKKRKPLFTTNVHSDLVVNWNLDNSKINLNNGFSQGIIDCSVGWNVKKWYDNLEKVKTYIDENSNRPSSTSKLSNTKKLGVWISAQVKNYKKKIEIMKNNDIRKSWEDFVNDERYKEYFLDNESIWYDTLEKVKTYIDENNKRPSSTSKDPETKKIAGWIGTQQKNYKKKIEIMKNNDIRKSWEEFVNDDKYKEYFLDNETIWYDNLEKVKTYIDENNKRPSSTSKDPETKKLANWIHMQINNYKKKEHIMKNNDIVKSWEDFVNDERYKEYFLDNESIWYDTLEKVKTYIDENNKRPSQDSKDPETKKIAGWIGTQQKNYKKKEHIMKNNDIRKSWEDFVNDERYKEYLMDNESIWYDNLEKVKKYIDENKKRPSSTSKDHDIKKLGLWIKTQITNYNKKECIMKNNDIRKSWEDFVNNEKYKEYLMDNESIWYDTLEKLKEYINKNNQKPSSISKDSETKQLGQWITTQITNYKKKVHNMTNDDIRKSWEDFVNDERYKEYLMDNESIWYDTLEKIKTYIDENNQKPSRSSKDPETKKLANWIHMQINNYKKKRQIMKNNDIRKSWQEFVNDQRYKVYFLDNESIWYDTLEKIKTYIDENNQKPSKYSKDPETKQLGKWITHQQQNYKKKEHIMKNNNIRKSWEDFVNNEKYKEYLMDNESIWYDTLEKIKTYIDENNQKPSKDSKDTNTKKLGNWISNQQKNYKNKKYIMTNDDIRKSWEDFVMDDNYSKYFTKFIEENKIVKKSVNIKPKDELESKVDKEINKEIKKNRKKSDYQELSRKISSQTSKNTNEMFSKNPNLWEEYHEYRDHSFKGYDIQNEIPVNKIINYLESKQKHKLTILDLGCGRNLIVQHFKSNKKFKITGYDHISYNGSIKNDISKLPEEDDTIKMCIYSQSLMGSNWKEYLNEGHRVLEYNGEMIVSESIERYQLIKDYLISMNMHIKNEDYEKDKRWFFIYAIKV